MLIDSSRLRGLDLLAVNRPPHERSAECEQRERECELPEVEIDPADLVGKDPEPDADEDPAPAVALPVALLRDHARADEHEEQRPEQPEGLSRIDPAQVAGQKNQAQRNDPETDEQARRKKRIATRSLILHATPDCCHRCRWPALSWIHRRHIRVPRR